MSLISVDFVLYTCLLTERGLSLSVLIFTESCRSGVMVDSRSVSKSHKCQCLQITGCTGTRTYSTECNLKLVSLEQSTDVDAEADFGPVSSSALSLIKETLL